MKGKLFCAGVALVSVLAAVGCGSGSSSSGGGFFSNNNQSNNVPPVQGRVVLNFDSPPAGVDSIQAVFLDANGQRIGEPFEVPITGKDFVIDNPPSNFASVEIDYLRNGGYALFESFHLRGTKTTISARVESSPTTAPQLRTAPTQRTKWTTSLGPAAFHVEASGNPGVDLPAQDAVFKVKGVGYSPAPIGFSNEDGPGFGDLFWDGGQNIPNAGILLDWSKVWQRDIENIRSRFNAVRCYSICSEHTDSNGQFQPSAPVNRTHQKFLDACWNNGNKPVYVLVGIPLPADCFFSNHNATNRANFERVMAKTLAETKDHPAVMGYTFFNEIGGDTEWGNNPTTSTYYWNQIKTYSEQIKSTAPDKLCGFAYFDAPPNVSNANTGGYLATYGGSIDFWGVNAFQATTIAPSLAPYKALTTAKKPVLFTEFSVPATSHRDQSLAPDPAFATQAGVDSIFADATTIGRAAQAMRTMLPLVLTDDIVAGMLYFEWNDEYWKQPSTAYYTTTKGGQQGGKPAALSQMPNGFDDQEGYGLNAIGLNGRAISALFDPFNTGAATANNRPDILTPRSELLDAVTTALQPVR